MMIKWVVDGLITWPKQTSSKFSISLVKKPKIEKKMTFSPPPGFSLRHKSWGHGYDKARTNVIACDINKTKSFEQVFINEKNSRFA